MNSMYENVDVHDIRNVRFCSMHKQWIWKQRKIIESCTQDFFSIDLGLNISLKYNYTYNTMQKLQSVVRYGIQTITQLILSWYTVVHRIYTIKAHDDKLTLNTSGN